MCAAPLPSGSELHISKSDLVFFRDTSNDIYTIEHPLTQRFLKVLERQRLDAIAHRAKRSVYDLSLSQPDLEFHKRFPHLQLPCGDCGMCQSTQVCVQCIASFCDSCFDLLHASGPRREHESRRTPAGSLCASCGEKPPQAFCDDCVKLLCFKCFDDAHARGSLKAHRVMRVDATNGNLLSASEQKCDECKDVPPSVYCDFCMDSFCLVCFWCCHLNGNRRQHTASLVISRPLCSQCETTRASLFCEQCQEMLCSACFANTHERGNRKLHLFMDAMNVLSLLEKLDPSFQDFMRVQRQIVLNAIMKIQAHARGRQHRNRFRRKRELATLIQSRWRGGEARKKLMGVLDQFNWRKRQVNSALTDSRQLEQRSHALESRAKVAAVQQNRAVSQLRKDLSLLDEEDLLAVVQKDDSAHVEPKQIASPTELLKSRINMNLRESQKLRRLLNIDAEK